MAKLKAKKKCVKGFACGYACIKRGKVCRKNAGEAVEEIVNNYAKAAGGYVSSNTTKADLLSNATEVGEGTFANAYLTPDGSLVKLSKFGSKDSLSEEAKITELLGKAGYAPKLIQAGSIGDNAYIEMEYLDDFTTLANSKYQALTDNQIDKLGKAIEFMHKNGLTHGDLHSENVMVNEADDDLKLIDFGNSTTMNFNTLKDDLNSYQTLAEALWPEGSPQAKFLDAIYKDVPVAERNAANLKALTDYKEAIKGNG